MNNFFKDTRKLTFMGVMLAITLILDWTPLSNLPIGPVGSTILHLPTIITGIILGPLAGLIMGTFMGITSWIHAIQRPITLLDPFFIYPWVSVIPRMFIGVVSGYVFIFIRKLLIKNNEKKLGYVSISATIAGIAGSVTNTVLVFLSLYIFYAKDVVEKLQDLADSVVAEGGSLPFKINFNAFFVFVATTNGVAELITAAVVSGVIAVAYYQYNKTRMV